MKKIILAMAAAAVITMVAAPAMAATEWNFGASIRFQTFYTDLDYGKGKGADLEGGGARVNSDGKLDWSTQGNSRLKFFMRSDKLQGYAELGYNFNSNSVTTRELWGKYNFGQGWAVTIGQAHQLFNIPAFSNQVWGSDLNMVGTGVSFRPPTPKIILSYGGFAFALSEPHRNNLDSFTETIVDPVTSNITVNGYGADIDTYVPQAQASYTYAADTWGIKIAGAFQTQRMKNLQSYSYDDATSTFTYGNRKNKTINSWLVDIKGNVDFGPLYVKATASVGQNWANADWNTSRGGLGNSWANQKSLDNYRFQFGNNNKIKNTTSAMGAIILGYRLTEALKFEAGAGYRYDDNNNWDSNSDMWNFYLQAAYTVTPGFTITPEIGYIDLGRAYTPRNTDKGAYAGALWYAGAKWQFDF